MEKIFSKETIKNVPDRELNEIVNNFLNSDHGLTRSMSIIQIALRVDEDYEKYSKILLNEMNKHIHFLGIRFGIKSGWTIAISLIENLKKEDYPKIKKEFDKWDKEEKEGLLDWLKNFPDHCKILREGIV
ncbi:hypothetical protein CMU93_15610 [Elizabethkingia anophelis]|uniref:hypothetical protein n=1 Tax=Elizabethkingia anophelis TaxID=1117645 RepID=UPI00038A55D2|nr:hypothetical protein [Elizabethkingia anophelis]EQB93064.1 hypothetical protein C874_16885 [Elizabethkingia anophelis 502]MCT4139046.1 hypothetical protein [Elizabethkingia anophelis]MDV2448925.1 hypothetical protein [Elizabethkingia anophelis]